jgi:hypothetical protein
MEALLIIKLSLKSIMLEVPHQNHLSAHKGTLKGQSSEILIPFFARMNWFIGI